MKYDNITEDALKILSDKRLFKNNYKMKCLKWHQRLYIFINSWIKAIQLLPIVWTSIKKQKNG